MGPPDNPANVRRSHSGGGVAFDFIFDGHKRTVTVVNDAIEASLGLNSRESDALSGVQRSAFVLKNLVRLIEVARLKIEASGQGGGVIMLKAGEF